MESEYFVTHKKNQLTRNELPTKSIYLIDSNEQIEMRKKKNVLLKQIASLLFSPSLLFFELLN